MKNPTLYSPINPHFFQPLLPGFTNHLDIPVAFFLKHLDGSSQGKTAELTSDASEITWKMKIDGRRFSDGWEDFAAAHDFRVGDNVVFRHEGEFVFHVSALGPSCCEIQYGKDSDEEDQLETLCETKNVSKKRKRPKTEANPHSIDQSSFVAIVTASNLRRDTLYLPKAFVISNGLMKKVQIVLMNEEGESSTIDFRHEAYSGRFYIRRGWTSFCVANGKKPGDLFTLKLVRNEATPLLQLLPLNSEDLENFEKRPETEVASSPDHSCFEIAVTTSNLRRDTVFLPKAFAVANSLINKSQIVLMNEKGESWTIDLRHEVYSGRFNMRRGWKRFCDANGKKRGDLFTFKLVRNEQTPVLQLLPLNLDDMDKLEPSNNTRQ